MVGKVRPAVDARVRPVAVGEVRAERLDRLGRGRRGGRLGRGGHGGGGGRAVLGRSDSYRHGGLLLLLLRLSHVVAVGSWLLFDRVVVVALLLQLPHVLWAPGLLLLL